MPLEPKTNTPCLKSVELPAGLKESGLTSLDDMDEYLSYVPQVAADKNIYLKDLCNEILDKGVKCASFSLNTQILRYGIRSRGNLENPATVIAEMFSKATCRLEYLDLSNSNLQSEELIKILKASSQSSLKCIYIGYNDWTINNLKEFESFLENSKSNVLVLGLHHLFIHDGKSYLTWEKFSQIDGEITKKLDLYNRNIAPVLNLDVRLQKDFVRLSYDNERISLNSMYH